MAHSSNTCPRGQPDLREDLNAKRRRHPDLRDDLNARRRGHPARAEQDPQDTLRAEIESLKKEMRRMARK